MANETKKFAGLQALQIFLNNCKSLFAPITHKHDEDYEVKGSVSTHNVATDTHNDIRILITELTTRLNTLADSDDTTLDQMSEIVAYIKSNKDLIESVTTSKVSVEDIIDNLTTNVSNKPLSSGQGVVLKGLIDTLQTEVDSHNHEISDVSGLQEALNSKAGTSHGEHVTYATTAPLMDGIASAGTAATVSRTDHVHPTDTTRASKLEFDSHISDATKHITLEDVEAFEFITVEDIDTIWGTGIQNASEVTF